MDSKRHSPSALRNREPIREVLARWLPAQGRVLELPCGVGVHAAWLSAAFPALEWIPADIDPEALDSTRAWRSEGGPRLAEPVQLDVLERPWRVGPVDVVLSVNLIHAAPPEVMPALVAGAAEALVPGGLLVLYGPFREAGRTAPSNEAFERDYLKQRDPRWGLRELDELTRLAAAHGLARVVRVEMPANNLSVLFRRGPASASAQLG